ncbi:hypothetical protein ACFV29_20330 [Streptomyces sp. NPDC059690]|uniref:hypothetical protein n=1 Tax=Streptomyces sp. NPDC059690 TaxID=3346907 RepID=UPI0036B027C5
MSRTPLRLAVVGTGHRARTVTHALATPPATAWPPGARAASDSGAPHRDTAAEHARGARLTLRPLWKPPAAIPLEAVHEAHGGGDPRMLDALFGPVDAGRPSRGPPSTPAPSRRPRGSRPAGASRPASPWP